MFWSAMIRPGGLSSLGHEGGWMSQVVSSVCPQEHHTLWSQGCWQRTLSSQAEQGPGEVGAVSESMDHPKQ